jgi:hypothetical protein
LAEVVVLLGWTVACSCPAWALAAAGQWPGIIEGPGPRRVVLMMERTNAAQGVVYLLDDDNPGWAHATTN